MGERRCTIDSSCIIALDHLDLVPRLSLLFSTVLVPKAVRDELFKVRETEDRLRLIFENYAFFQRCDGYEHGAVDFLLAERNREGAKDRGEVEAIVQASQFGATVVIDDLWGRKQAKNHSLDVHGTVWVLQQFHDLDLLSPAALRDCFESLRQRGTRWPWETVSELLSEIGQPRLT